MVDVGMGVALALVSLAVVFPWVWLLTARGSRSPAAGLLAWFGPALRWLRAVYWEMPLRVATGRYRQPWPLPSPADVGWRPPVLPSRPCPPPADEGHALPPCLVDRAWAVLGDCKRNPDDPAANMARIRAVLAPMTDGEVKLTGPDADLVDALIAAFDRAEDAYRARVCQGCGHRGGAGPVCDMCAVRRAKAAGVLLLAQTMAGASAVFVQRLDVASAELSAALRNMADQAGRFTDAEAELWDQAAAILGQVETRRADLAASMEPGDMMTVPLFGLPPDQWPRIPVSERIIPLRPK
jgi:hypothetical protein